MELFHFSLLSYSSYTGFKGFTPFVPSVFRLQSCRVLALIHPRKVVQPLGVVLGCKIKSLPFHPLHLVMLGHPGEWPRWILPKSKLDLFGRMLTRIGRIPTRVLILTGIQSNLSSRVILSTSGSGYVSFACVRSSSDFPDVNWWRNISYAIMPSCKITGKKVAILVLANAANVVIIFII